jgi:transcriptional regulator with PAS, ATPase and Fis domain
MTLFCDGPVIFPKHVIFPPDLEPNRFDSEHKMAPATVPDRAELGNGIDLSLASAVKRHVHYVYEQANRNQRRTAKLLGISRATLARHLRNAGQNQST